MLKTRSLLGAGALLMSSGVQATEPAGLKSALAGERLGLLPAMQFRLSNGNCPDCVTIKQGLWYFQNEVLAVPLPSQPVSSFKRGGDIVRGTREWAPDGTKDQLALPGLVWLGAPHILDDAHILPDGAHVRTSDDAVTDLALAPKIASNLSYWDPKTTAFFAKREVRMRGTYSEADGKSSFVARTVWPKDFTIDQATMRPQPLGKDETFATYVRAEGGGASSPFSTRLLWERKPGQARQWQEKPVLGMMLNGAQGDDDEAYGGHFAVATGHLGREGEWSDWIVNNFYNLDSVSEKGIIAAPVPMDNYLMDLNSGQQYYRPSYMLVAVLSHARTAAAYQGGVQRVFNHFYRHDFTYQHAKANCAGISLDVFKGLGWNIPQRGPTSNIKALGAYAYLSAKDMSLASGRKIYDYLTEEQVRLYPAVAFEAAGNDLLQLVGATKGKARKLTAYEKQLQHDIEGLVLVRIPQVPSSRVMGSNPVFSFSEFMKRTPPNQADWKIVPVGPRPFPEALRDANTPPPKKSSLVPLPIAGIAFGGVIGLGALIRRRRKKRASAG
ncbi:hypothetical protein [Massilia pseudoviolaceinigra]|uniref:hypothetical protein n=1 Tax=Massilia pseudoviolaceinigra TaxID=3057165 RepID=UPI0027968DC6|nr:hypothetical protein [Massilia sp. CCM 9206]MDQ1919967.1 hypothetical protein [Massilia sp. CCM 9206]